jgi:polynucleotide 5'-hydroxyl-kinase GRC3/NOL9
MLPNGDESQTSQHFPFLSRLEILPQWEAAAARWLQVGGVVLVLGAPDTGKSTLCRYLLYRAYLAGERAALIDLDLGQSHLGPPTTLGLGFFPPRRPGDGSLFPEGLHFIGQTSPVGAVLEVAVGCRVLCDQARGAGLTRVVVNTSGFTQGPGALKLKRSQAKLLDPALILALQRAEELEPLLRGLGAGNREEPHPGPGTRGEVAPGPPPTGWPLVRLPVSARVVRRAAEQRRAYREERFRRYFRRARGLDLPWRPLVWEGLPLGWGHPLAPADLAHISRSLALEALYGESQGSRLLLLLPDPPSRPLDAAQGQPFPWETAHWISWSGLHFRLVGLLDGRGRTLALGLIQPAPWNPETLALWTPLETGAASRVRGLKMGKIKVNLDGQEL